MRGRSSGCTQQMKPSSSEIAGRIAGQGLRRRVHKGQAPLHVVCQHHLVQILGDEAETGVAMTQRLFRAPPARHLARQQLFQLLHPRRFEFLSCVGHGATL